MRDPSMKVLQQHTKSVSQKKRNKLTAKAPIDEKSMLATGSALEHSLSKKEQRALERRGYKLDESGDSSGTADDVDDADLVQDKYNESIAALSNKYANKEQRISAIGNYANLLGCSYGGFAIQAALPDIMTQLVRNVRRGDHCEIQTALHAIMMTAVSCTSSSDAGIVFDSTLATLKKLVKDPTTHNSDRVLAIRAMALVTVCGCGIPAIAEKLADFLLEIAETDGGSVHCFDSGSVVTEAIQSWCFVVSYMVDAAEEDQDDDDDDDDADSTGACVEVYQEAERRSAKPSTEDGYDSNDFLHGEDYLVSQSQRAFDVFVDQLQSEDVDVQMSAASAIALLFEASRIYTEHQGCALDLQCNPAQLVEEMCAIGRGAERSSKSAKPDDRRRLRACLRDVVTSLERAKGPSYRTTLDPKSLDPNGGSGCESEHGYKEGVVLGGRYMTVDTWCKSIRISMLRSVLKQGFGKHLSDNLLVQHMIEAKDLQETPMSQYRESGKAVKLWRLSKSKKRHSQ
ncbi:ifrd domain containing protein [Ophiostoma piceae UAMH 11346]|uniref:Ifrd domain containing protein n=1 Tax=Ophiostoma piceae (strain UAMH 11346) TaxID=1262450 RepID=S3C5W8_OPHP1|nr:ifrd domain containing protein [Ophiostoma piceae UAMH 11346]